MKRKALYSFFKLYVLYGLFAYSYNGIASVWSYMGFPYSFDISRLVVSLILFTLLNVFFLKLYAENVYYQVITYLYLLIFIPQLVFFVYNPDQSSKQLIIYLVFFTTMLIFSDKATQKLTYLKINAGNINERKTRHIIFFLFIILLIPFLQKIKYFTLNNFNLYLIYIERFASRNNTDLLQGFMDYAINPLTRVVIPVFGIYYLRKKRYLLSTLLFLIIIVLFASTGGLKSMLLIVPVSLFFSKMSYKAINNTLYSIPFVILLLGLIEKTIIKTNLIQDILVRRVFFLPPLLEKFYLEHYDELLFYKYSFLKGLFGFDKSITKEIGYYYFDNLEMNANIGLIVEGFLSLGIVGVFLHAIIIAYMFRHINFQNIESAYFGIIFVMMYVVNTSFIAPFMLTHGFATLILLASFINRKQKGFKFTKP